MTFELAPAGPADVVGLAGRLRAIDQLETRAMAGACDDATLRASVRASKRAWVGLVGGRVEGVCGVVPCPNGTPGAGCPWVLVTDVLLATKERRAHFLRLTPTLLAAMSVGFLHLYNFVHRDNHASRRWLRWAGFDFTGPVAIGGEPFEGFFRECAPQL